MSEVGATAGLPAAGDPLQSPGTATDAPTPVSSVASTAPGPLPAEGSAGAIAPSDLPVETPARGRLGLRRPRLHVRVGLPRSRRGILALVLILGGLGMAGVFTGATLVRWTETADFCGRCHQMGPELAAYEAGPHRDVACAECHVEPGAAGWVKAKINGTKQLFQVILGLYPKPVPPPDHAALPSTQDTCQRCHSVERLAIAQTKTTAQFAEDEANTRQVIGLMIRPAGGDQFDVNRSVHWHVLQDVTYASAQTNSQSIDLVQIHETGGGSETFIAQKQIKVSDDVQPDVDRILAADRTRRMDCIDCHNRAGHDIPDPRTSVDYDMATGKIDASLPYVKRESMRILWASYPDVTTADAAADGLRGFYELNYPDLAKTDSAQISGAIADLKVLYQKSATPEMKVSAGTYPDNLGHMDFPGCFRCHDGGHYLIKDGKVTDQVIPSACNTCHTFPQIGGQVATLPLGTPPTTHADPLYVFTHKGIATSTDPGKTSCGECHAKDYCDACHSTGAVKVDHEQMLTNHAAVIRQSGNTACAYCHQPVYCARCHTEQVLPVTGPFWGAQPPAADTPTSGTPASRGPTGLVAPPAATPAAPKGVRWPLLTIGVP